MTQIDTPIETLTLIDSRDNMQNHITCQSLLVRFVNH